MVASKKTSYGVETTVERSKTTAETRSRMITQSSRTPPSTTPSAFASTTPSPLYDNALWSEKHRPKTLDDIILKEDQRETLSSFTSESMPNLILSGPPGCGKTTTGLVLAYSLLKDKRAFIELNASDNRGIGMIGNLVDNFCRIRTRDEIMIIMLDEADNITRKAQQLLVSQIIQPMSHIRFIFTCNAPSELVNGIQSASLHMHFDPPANELLVKRLKGIALKEDFEVSNDTIHMLIERSGDDGRKSVNNLQLLHMIDRKISDGEARRIISESSLLITARVLLLCKGPQKQFLREFHRLYIGTHGYIDFVTMLINIYMKGEQLPFFKRILRENNLNLTPMQESKVLELTSSVYFFMMETYESPLLITRYLIDLWKVFEDSR